MKNNIFLNDINQIYFRDAGIVIEFLKEKGKDNIINDIVNAE